MLGDVEIAKIYFCASGRWSELQRALKCVERAGKVLLGNADDAEKVKALDTFWIFGEFGLNLPAGFVEATLLEQGLRFLKARVDFIGLWRGRFLLR